MFTTCIRALPGYTFLILGKVSGFSCDQHRADLSSPVVIPAGYGPGAHTPGTAPSYRFFVQGGPAVPGSERLQSGRTVAFPAEHGWIGAGGGPVEDFLCLVCVPVFAYLFCCFC